ncbi:MAG: mechanosensitive ion channel family protein [Alphaproteobacteria bacterium]|nr:mechanosensitive ion channel family protein [Alphaproteobacteria bacterium]
MTHWRLRAAIPLIAAFLFAAALVTPAIAQDTDTTVTAELPAGLSQTELEGLIARMTDAEVRQVLIKQLEVIAAQSAIQEVGGTASFFDNLEVQALRLRERRIEVFSAIDEVPAAFVLAYDRLTSERTISFWSLIGWVVLLPAVGFIGTWIFTRVTARTRANIVDAAHVGASERLVRVVLRSLLDLLTIVAFLVPVLIVFFLFLQGDETVRQFVITFVSAVVAVRLIGTVSRLVIAPYAPALRFAPLSDEGAFYCHRWLMWIATIAVFGFLIRELFQVLGIPEAAIFILMIGIGLLVAGLILVLVWHSRQPVAAYIRGPSVDHTVLDRIRGALADIWPVLATAYVVVVWLIWAAGLLSQQPSVMAGAILSLLIIVAVPLADRIAHHLLDHYLPHTRPGDDQPGPSAEPDFAAGADAGDEAEVEAIVEPAGAHRQRNAYAIVIHHAARVVIVAAAFLGVLGVWGINLWTTAEQTFGGAIARTALDVVVVLVIAFIGWELIKTAIDLKLNAEANGPDGANDKMSEGEGGQAGSRIATMLPLLRKFLAVVIVVMVAMIILSSLSVDIGPLLAGAGVIGLAIGFGAQTLVRDIVSGVFYLLDDAFRMGEYIDTGDVKGTVEGIRLRSLRLRHHRGPVNTIPYGELSKIINYSRDWVIMKLEFRVPYDTDMVKVKRIIKEIGKKLAADPDMGPNLLQTLKSQGVYAMEDSAIVVKVKFKAIPGEQFLIRREAYQLIQKAFAENGIKFAHRQVTVHVPSAADEEDEDEVKSALQGAGAALTADAAEAPST